MSDRMQKVPGWLNALMVGGTFAFHHSNVDLPPEMERRLSRILVTPRMHGIHHSIVENETNSNWSSGFTVWDWLHGTLRRDVPQEEITIGVPAYRELTLPRVVAMPFEEQRDPWRLPDGTRSGQSGIRDGFFRNAANKGGSSLIASSIRLNV